MDSTQQPIVVELVGRVAPADVPLLCARLQAQVVAAEGAEVICDVGALVVADLTAVDAVARLRLTARRLGRELRLTNAGPELLALLAFVGLGRGDDPDRPSALSPQRPPG